MKKKFLKDKMCLIAETNHIIATKNYFLPEKESKGNRMKYSHLGIPTKERFSGEIDIPHLKMTVSDHKNNPYGIQWMRFWSDSSFPELVKTIPHVAFEVDNLKIALLDKKIIIEPNSPSEGLIVAFIEMNGTPVELMEYKKGSVKSSTP